MRLRTSLAAICVVLIAATLFSAEADAQRRRGRRAKAPVVKLQTASVDLTEQGYEPASVKLRRGIPARVTFTRKVSATCGKEVVLPDYGIRRDLPLNEPVVVEFTPDKSGKFAFTCGMGMLRGTVIVQ